MDLRTGTPSPDQVRSAVRAVLRSPRYRQHAQRIQADYAGYNAPEAAATLLERLAATQRPVLRDASVPQPAGVAPYQVAGRQG